MKKTRILVPALAILALGMAASVTGTVAWFTANTQVKAESIRANVAQAQDLRIASGHTIAYNATSGWGNQISFTQALNDAMPVAAVDAEAIADVKQVMGAVGHYELEAAPLFVQPTANNQIDANGHTADALAAGNMTDKFSAVSASATTFVKEDYSLLYQGTDATKDVNFRITVTGTAKDIDKAYRIGIAIDGATFDVYSVASSYQFVGEDITLTKNVPARISIYVWYEGTDQYCVNQYAEKNQLQTRIDYSLTDTFMA